MWKLKFKKGDNVKITTGRSKGHVGRIISMFPKKAVALIEGANLVSRHTKPNSENPDGGIIKKEAPIHLSNLMLVDGKGNASKVGVKIDKKTGKKSKYFKTTGEIIK
tara:strand:- start:273 stop:593 length:321 start_codon:yes stop_codon:yes gene_type:complete